MENVSKALIIAGGTLIAILIISLGINLAGALQKQSKAYYETLSTQEIAKINGEITKDFVYLPGKTDPYITAQGIVTLKNLRDKLVNQGINITIAGSFISDNNEDILKEKAICDTLPNTGKTNYYKVQTIYTNGLITKINIDDTAITK